MASLEPSSPLSLLTLPVEIQAAITTYLEFFDLSTLRFANRYFYALVPAPTHAELLSAESLEPGFLACAGCTRLRPMATFSPKMTLSKKRAGGTQAHTRFCIECGRRPGPGEHRYTLGTRWKENEVPFVKCLSCKITAEGPKDQALRICVSCHRQDLERVRAAEVLKRVRSEAREREERRLRREERRRDWVERGFTPSDFSSADPREEDDSESDWGQDDDMNYSGHS